MTIIKKVERSDGLWMTIQSRNSTQKLIYSSLAITLRYIGIMQGRIDESLADFHFVSGNLQMLFFTGIIPIERQVVVYADSDV